MAKTECISFKVSPEEKELVKKLAANKEWTISKYLYNYFIKLIQEEQKNEKGI